MGHVERRYRRYSSFPFGTRHHIFELPTMGKKTVQMQMEVPAKPTTQIACFCANHAKLAKNDYKHNARYSIRLYLYRHWCSIGHWLPSV